MLLSRFDKNLPRILIASTRRPLVASIPIIVSTHSYRIAFPAFLFNSVFEATCRRNTESNIMFNTHPINSSYNRITHDFNLGSIATYTWNWNCEYQIRKIREYKEKLTWARTSFIYSLVSESPWPHILISLRTRICKKGSVIPAISYSGEYGLKETSFSIWTNPSEQFYN